MITGTTTDALYGQVIYTTTYTGFELMLGTILGALCAIVVWSTLKVFQK